jgi:hypothetical protein
MYAMHFAVRGILEAKSVKRRGANAVRSRSELENTVDKSSPEALCVICTTDNIRQTAPAVRCLSLPWKED